jgi:RNA polymerase sigma-70 factor, ECF subfamily
VSVVSDSDAALIAAHLAGDPDAFGLLMDHHRARMLATARGRTSSRDEALDVVQEATLKALRGVAGFRGEASVATWLHRIVVNTCLDRIKTSRVTALPWDVAFRVGSDPADPHNDITEAEMRLAVAEALDHLPKEQRVVLRLVHLEGLSLSEVAERLACPLGTVKSRCARGRAALAQHLGTTVMPD